MPQNLPVARASKIRSDLPLEVCGITLYPIRMYDYELFSACKDSLIVRLSTLPVQYISLNYAAALYALDMDAISENRQPSGLLARFIKILQLAMRIDDAELEKTEMLYKLAGGKKEFDAIVVVQDGKKHKLTANELSLTIRATLCEQNSLKLPDETANVDLIRDAEQLSQMQQATGLDVNIPDLIASVAYASNLREKDINDMTIREFESRRRAIERDKLYTLYSTAELSGNVKFPKGNPCPSWCYDKVQNGLGTVALEKITQNLGQQ